MHDLTVFDHLFGAFNIPDDLAELVCCPEIQRLQDIRLINMSSLTCQSLSEVRRLSHTLGVLRIAIEMSRILSAQYSAEELRTFLFAAALHDVGTPAFAHLFERELEKRYGWHHEYVVSDIIRGHYRPENIDHQVYFKSPLSVHKVLRKFGVDLNELDKLVRGKGDLGQLIAGSVDVDNLDNVFRMYSSLGFTFDRQVPLRIAKYIATLGRDRVMSTEILENIQLWATARRKCYEILFFAPRNLATQAMLSECFSIAVADSVLGPEYWHLTDDEILRRLLEYRKTKTTVKRLMTGHEYNIVSMFWLRHKPELAALLTSTEEVKKLAQELERVAGQPICVYGTNERGSFSKSLRITAGSNLKIINITEESRTTIVGVLTRSKGNIPMAERRRMREVFLSYCSIRREMLMDIPRLQDLDGFDRQAKLPL